ncbi:hypothetical protein AT574_03850 [Phaeobacter inhibens]|nr:hypothetical protein AT574_03850 [Phaeobacter inhibens]
MIALVVLGLALCLAALYAVARKRPRPTHDRQRENTGIVPFPEFLWAWLPPLRGVTVKCGSGLIAGVVLCSSGAIWLLWLLSSTSFGDTSLGRER